MCLALSTASHCTSLPHGLQLSVNGPAVGRPGPPRLFRWHRTLRPLGAHVCAMTSVVDRGTAITRTAVQFIPTADISH